MSLVIGVRFKHGSKIYFFDPTGVNAALNDFVIVETSQGQEIGEVLAGAHEVPEERIRAPLKGVMRAATREDMLRDEENTRREQEAFSIAMERIGALKLDMKLVDVECAFDGTRMLFYFTSNGRVDFRELVRELASSFKTRIEMRQIGIRDEARMIGGLGACGRPICCAAFLSDFQPVSIKMAKEQNLSLNPVKISGMCGRLMCCLKYEQDYYEETLKKLPKPGRSIQTPDGVGQVIDISVIKEKVRVKITAPNGTYEIKEYALDQVSRVQPVKDAVTIASVSLPPPISKPTTEAAPAETGDAPPPLGEIDDVIREEDAEEMEQSLGGAHVRHNQRRRRSGRGKGKPPAAVVIASHPPVDATPPQNDEP